jgi:hypothetical protein
MIKFEIAGSMPMLEGTVLKKEKIARTTGAARGKGVDLLLFIRLEIVAQRGKPVKYERV